LSGADFGKNYIWKWHTWLPFYLVAGSFKLFGEGTLTARLPFALFGMATIYAAYLLSMELWHSRRAALLSAFLLSLCVPFLLLCRQCRYYSLSTCFSLLGLYFYERMAEGKKYSTPLYLVSFFLLFHVNYVHAACLLCATFVHSLVTRNMPLKRSLAVFSGAFLLAAPWLVWLSTTSYSKQRYGGASFKLVTLTTNLSAFVQDLSIYVVTIPVFILSVLLFCALPIVRKNMTKAPIPCLWPQASIPIFFIGAILLVLGSSIPFPFFRYLAPVIPVLIVIIGYMAEQAFAIHLIAGLIIVVAFVFSQPLPAFFHELAHDYKGPIGGIVTFLKANAKPGDTVVITYGDLPLKFYTPLRVMGGMTGEDLSPARNADWVIIRKHIINHLPGGDLDVRNYLLHNINRENYQPIRIDCPDIPFENRESPTEHYFKTVQDEDPVVIFKKIR